MGEINVVAIVRQYVAEHGFDGLCCVEDWDGCGCLLEDLPGCDEMNQECRPGYVHYCDKCPRLAEDNCPVIDGGSAGSWCIGVTRKTPSPRSDDD